MHTYHKNHSRSSALNVRTLFFPPSPLGILGLEVKDVVWEAGLSELENIYEYVGVEGEVIH
jgi:hypothetical protein